MSPKWQLRARSIICAVQLAAALTVVSLSTVDADLIGRDWVQRYDGTDYETLPGTTDSYDAAEAVAVDGAGNAIVAGRANGFHVSKYSAADGTLLWERRVGSNRFFKHDSAHVVAVDQRGDVIAAGTVDDDFYTAKLSGDDGRVLWKQRYGGIGNDRDVAKGLAIDASGNVVVAGYAVVLGKRRDEVCTPWGTICHYPAPVDFYTAKYNGSDGRLVWERWFDGPDELDDSPAGVAVDSGGNVVVTGYTVVKRRGDATDADIYTIKYAAETGETLWQKQLDSGKQDWPHALAVNAAGDVIIAGRLATGAVIKLAGADGKSLWTRVDFASEAVWLGSVALDGVGNLAVAGACSTWDDGSGTASYHPLGDKIYVAKFRISDGELLWQRKYSRPADGDSDLGAGAVQFDRSGNVVVAGAGAITTNPYSWRLYTAKYAARNGAILWEKLFSAIGPQLEEVFGGMVLDKNDAPILTGMLYPRGPGAGDDVDIFIMKLGPIGQLLNISSRVEVGPGDEAPIAGFILTAPSGEAKRVLIRGIGPSLSGAGVATALANPSLELRTAHGRVVGNDDWKQSQEGEISGTNAAPADEREAAIVTTLGPGLHTVVLRGNGDERGTGLIEVYDLGATGPPILANVSTRGSVRGGSTVLIGGFIVGSSDPGRLLVRAIGPSMAVNAALPDPVLEIHDGNGVLMMMNDDWRSAQEAEIRATGIPPGHDREAAALAMFPPGPYTAIVRGKGDATGLALVEAYNVQ